MFDIYFICVKLKRYFYSYWKEMLKMVFCSKIDSGGKWQQPSTVYGDFFDSPYLINVNKTLK
jgi:hypothetical protein